MPELGFKASGQSPEPGLPASTQKYLPVVEDRRKTTGSTHRTSELHACPQNRIHGATKETQVAAHLSSSLYRPLTCWNTSKTAYRRYLYIKRPNNLLGFLRTTAPRTKGRILSTYCVQHALIEGRTGPHPCWWLRARPSNQTVDRVNRCLLNSGMEAPSLQIYQECSYLKFAMELRKVSIQPQDLKHY